MATILDWNHLQRKIEACRAAHHYQTNGEAFPHVILQTLFQSDDPMIRECLTDGGNDHGIDAVIVSHPPSLPEIHLFQFKCHEKFRAEDRNFPANEVPKIKSFLTDLLTRSPTLLANSNPMLKDKVIEINELIDQAVPKFYVHLCSNGVGLCEAEANSFRVFLESCGPFELHEHALETLVSRIVEDLRPRIDASITALGRVVEKTDGNIRGAVTTIHAHELVELIRDPDKPSQINEGIFHDNVRTFLGFQNDINEKIYQSSVNSNNYQFWYMNNGVTLICDDYSFIPTLENPRIKLTNAQIVNGRQTSSALFEAHRDSKEKLVGTSVLVRVYETKDKELSRSIAEATNSQTRINARNLRSNDKIQMQLVDYFGDRGFSYQRTQYEHQGVPDEKVVDSFRLGQVYLAYFMEHPDRARSSSDRIFDVYYDDIFNKSLNFDQLLDVYGIYLSIEKTREKILEEYKSNARKKVEFSFISHGYFHVLYAVKLLLQKDKVSIREVNVEEYIHRALIAIGSITSGLPERSRYEIFRAPKTTELIRAEIEGPQGDLFLDNTNVVSPNA